MKKFIPLFLLSFFLFGCSSLKKMQNNHLRENSFSTDQSQLIMQSDISTPMRVLKINAKVDSVILIKKSEDVFINPDDIVLQTFLKRLLNTVKDSLSLGVGIAAPQVGILKNIIWVQRFDKENSNRKYNCWNNFSGENVDFNKNNF